MRHYGLPIAAVALIVVSLANSVHALRTDTSPPAYEARRAVEQERFFENTANAVATNNKFWPGFARLWLNKDLVYGNDLIRQDYQSVLSRIATAAGVAVADLTPQMIGADSELRWWIQEPLAAYFFFSDQSDRFPGRLDAQMCRDIEYICWCWLQNNRHQILPGYTGDKGALSPADLAIVEAREVISRYNPAFALAINGTENGEVPRFPATLLAAQILKHSPDYQDLQVSPSGETPAEIYNGMIPFINAKWDQMARHGLLVEALTSYNTETLEPLYNLVDFCEDAVVREKTAMLLDLVWAEWAVGEINGVRGGGKCRKYSVGNGSADPWRYMSLYFFDMGPWEELNTPILASTSYRVPQVLKDIARDHVGRGDYTYVGKRFGYVSSLPISEIPITVGSWWNFVHVNTLAQAYDYATPDYVMGSLFVDPTKSTTDSTIGSPAGYAEIFAQNMLISIIFPTDLNARICPRGPAEYKSLLQYHAVQHKNVMIVQKHPRAQNIPIMQIYFSAGMKARLVENAGWRFLEEGDAFVAVKAFSSSNGTSTAPTSWVDDYFLNVDDLPAPIVFVLGRRTKHSTLAAFQNHVLSSTSGLSSQKFTFNTTDADDQPLQLALYLNASALPQVNGTAIDLQPTNVFDSPFFSSVHDSGMVTIQKGPLNSVYNFNTTTVTNMDDIGLLEPPMVQQFAPLDDGIDVGLDANLTLTFDKPVTLGTGTVQLVRSSDGTVIESFDIATSPRLTLSGYTLTIDPVAALLPSTDYHLLMDPGALTGSNGADFPGIGASDTWNFTTVFWLPFTESFEARTPGDLNGQFGWAADGAVVQGDVTYGGSTKACAITNQAGFARHAFSDARSQVWFDFRVRASYPDRDGQRSPMPGTAFCMYVAADGRIMAFDGQTPVPTGRTVADGQWMRGTAFCNYAARTWDLYIDEAWLGRFNFFDPDALVFSEISVEGDGTVVDNIAVTETIPTIATPLPFYESFEDRVPGHLNGQFGWAATGADVQSAITYAGSANACAIADPGGFVRHAFSNSYPEVWIDCRIQASYRDREEPPEPLPGTAFSLYVASDGRIMAFDGPTPVPTGRTATEGQWIRVTVFCDHTSKAWDLYIGGLSAGHFGFFDPDAVAFSELGAEGEGTTIDNITITLDRPPMPEATTLLMVR